MWMSCVALAKGMLKESGEVETLMVTRVLDSDRTLVTNVEEEPAAPSGTRGKMHTSTRESSITTVWLATFTSQICGSS